MIRITFFRGQQLDSFATVWTAATKVVGSVIGRGGSNISDLQARSGAHVQIDNENAHASAVVGRVSCV